ncbi:hypothetical protein GF336_02880 [Candidatus Woesearchaeota archaeon]|nr:hypothetical protein [Candidatus Woesearchaeota archaeon]
MACILERVEKYLRAFPRYHETLRERATLRNRVKKEFRFYTRRSDLENPAPFHFEQIKKASELPDHISDGLLYKAINFYHEETAKDRNVFYVRGRVGFRDREYVLSSDKKYKSITREQNLDKPLNIEEYF